MTKVLVIGAKGQLGQSFQYWAPHFPHFKFFFKVENLKLMEGSYDVSISSKNISHFKNKSSEVEYWIALEPESTYSA